MTQIDPDTDPDPEENAKAQRRKVAKAGHHRRLPADHADDADTDPEENAKSQRRRDAETQRGVACVDEVARSAGGNTSDLTIAGCR